MKDCDICGKTLKNERAHRAHLWRSHTANGQEQVKNLAAKAKTKPNFFKGKTKETCEIVARIAIKNKKIKEGTFHVTPMYEPARQRYG